MNRRLELAGSEIAPEQLAALVAARPDLEHLTIWGGTLTSADLAPLASLTSLRGLALGEMRIDDSIFGYLRHLEKLDYLNLAYTAVRGDFTPLKHLPLRDLRLEGCRFVGDACAGTLAAIPTLRQLELHMTGVTDAGVAALSGLPVEVLWLGPRVTDAATHTLAGMPTLRHLDICAHNVSDVGAMELATLPNLEILWLTRCDLTDSCVGALCSLPGLKELNVNHTGITQSGLAKLRAALPDCRLPEPD